MLCPNFNNNRKYRFAKEVNNIIEHDTRTTVPLFSVIIPIYNIEDYLQQCLESILEQQFDDFELILVDDGSTDKSHEICLEYAANDNRIRLLNIKHSGIASARNAGLDAATGEYILFIDGDDFIDKSSFVKLKETLDKDGHVDYVFLKAHYYYPDETMSSPILTVNRDKIYKQEQSKVLDYLSRQSDFHAPLWCKLIKRHIYEDNNLRCDKNKLSNEDSGLSMHLFIHSFTYTCSDYVYYYRREREGSITYEFDSGKYLDYLETIEEWSTLDKGKYKAYHHFIRRSMAYQVCILLLQYGLLSSYDRKKFYNRSKELTQLFRHSSDLRVHCVQLFTALFGVYTTSIFLRLYSTLKDRRRISNKR